MLIPVLVEPNYQNYIWAKQTLESILQEAAKRKYKAVPLQSDGYEELDYDAIFQGERRMLIVIGTSISWMPAALNFFNSRKIETVFISFDPSEVKLPTGMVRMDYVGAVDQLISYLENCGKSRIAMYGYNPNSSADQIKVRFYRSRLHSKGVQEEAIFENLADLKDCYRRFQTEIHRFDGVICANDVVACSLMSMLKEDGIRVPEDLYVTAFGNSLISERISPALTVATLDHHEMGRQAVHLFSYLVRMPSAASVSVRVRCKLIVRGSTAFEPDRSGEVSPVKPDSKLYGLNFYSDPEAEWLLRAECLLGAADETDLKLVDRLLQDIPLDELEKELYLTPSALQYRKKKLMNVSGCKTSEEFMKFLFFCRKRGVL